MLTGDRLPTLETARLRLRWLDEADAPALFTIFSDADVCRYWSSPPYEALAEAVALVDEIHRLFRAKTLFEWGVAERETDAVIGTVTLAHLDPQNRRAELGFSVARARWGQGIASEAVTAALAFGFTTLGLHRVEADVDPRNAASIRVLEKLGFAREGLMRERWIVGEERCDSLFLGLLAREWRARDGAPAPEG